MEELTFHKRHPCSHCPFKKDTLKGWLGEERATEIVQAFAFTCHKTNEKLQCAGHMIVSKERSRYVATAEYYNIPLNLKGQNVVFDTEEDFINHHKN
jgi:hypothetical protein